jgi:hypothetical protein
MKKKQNVESVIQKILNSILKMIQYMQNVKIVIISTKKILLID